MKKFFKNNKGFTLVELIIVIAVMAILTVVAAPQYIKYVEKSRVGVDENAIGEIAHIAEVEFVEYAVTDTASADLVFTVTVTNGTPAFAGDLASDVSDVFGTHTFKSNTYENSTITFTIDAVGDAANTVGTGKCTWQKTA